MEWLIGVIALIVTGLASWALGRTQGAGRERERQEGLAARGYAETREKADEADIVGDDPDAAARWLRERNPDQR